MRMRNGERREEEARVNQETNEKGERERHGSEITEKGAWTKSEPNRERERERPENVLPLFPFTFLEPREKGTMIKRSEGKIDRRIRSMTQRRTLSKAVTKFSMEGKEWLH